jgi:RNA polymerase sigma-70 factor, ECF subfamily
VDRKNERRLLERIHAGERAACEELVRAHYEAIYRFLAYMVRDSDLAADLTQETFAAAWARIGEFEGRSAFRTWLHRIACGSLADVRRKLRRVEMLAAARGPEERQSPEASPLEAVMASEWKTRIDEALAALRDEADRVVLVLHYYQGLSFAEVASVVGEPVGTVKWRASRALGRLRAILGERCDDER